MSTTDPCGQNPPFDLTALAEFTQPPVDGGLINVVAYARQKYGTRPPDGYTPNIAAVISLLNNLASQQSDPQVRESIIGAIEYLTYLNETVLTQLPGILNQLIAQMVNATLA